MLSRRSLFVGIGALLAAPAIVRAESIMKVRALPPRLVLSHDEIIAIIDRQLQLYAKRWFDSKVYDLIQRAELEPYRVGEYTTARMVRIHDDVFGRAQDMS